MPARKRKPTKAEVTVQQQSQWDLADKWIDESLSLKRHPETGGNRYDWGCTNPDCHMGWHSSAHYVDEGSCEGSWAWDEHGKRRVFE